MKSLYSASLGAALLAFAVGASAEAQATALTSFGSGTFSASSPIDPGGTWSFSFNTVSEPTFNPTDEFTDFTFSPSLGTATSLNYFSSGSGGLFTISFSSGNSIEFYGAQVYTGGVVSTVTATAAVIDYNNSDPTYLTGVGSGTVTIEAAVPEASTWVMMLAGFATLGFAGYRTGRKVAA